MNEMNRKVSGSCIVFKDNKVLLVRHTYGPACGKYLIPGGFSEYGELPAITAKREVFEETKVVIDVNELVAVRFTTEEVWCIFNASYISGEPTSDLMENDSAIFMDIETAIQSDVVVETTRVLIKSLYQKQKSLLVKSKFINSRYSIDTWQLYL